MALNAQAMDNATRCRFFRVNQFQVPLTMGFDLVTLDGLQFYEPTYGGGNVRNDKGQTLRGRITEAVFLKADQALPIPEQCSPINMHSQFACWEYHSI